MTVENRSNGKKLQAQNALSQAEGRASSMFCGLGWIRKACVATASGAGLASCLLQSIYAVSQKHRRLAFPGGPELRVLERWNQLSRDERGRCKRGHVRAIECQHPYYFRMKQRCTCARF